MRFTAKNLPFLLLCAGLIAWVFFLRWPSFARPAWNLDEGIHATIARTILDGGVMYRDAIDQRTPLTYYLVAGAFFVFGENNMAALHALLAGMVGATAIGLYLLGRCWRNSAMGLWAALIFCAFSNNLFYLGDAYSVSTEWFLIFFTTWSTWWFWRSWEKKSLWHSAVAGAGFSAAFLCKQPGLLDFGAPLALLAYMTASGRWRLAEAARQLLGLCAGFVGFTAAVFAYFWVKGALDDFYFYAWSYNLLYYGPETAATDRLLAAAGGFEAIRQRYPLIGIAVIAGVLGRLLSLGQRQPTEDEHTTNPPALYLLVWALLALAGASSAGRIYHHYYLQFLPAFALLAGWFLAACQARWISSRSIGTKGLTGLMLAAAAWSVIAGPLRGPWPATLGPEAATDSATYIREHSKPTDRIFVWGYNPDYYLLADRLAASRYIYCSFLTGLIPWTNTAPGLDTSYGIVPGTMDILLRELEKNRPRFFVDTSLGGGRQFTKYPLLKFPRLAAYVAAHYREIEPTRFRAHGFRVLIRTDDAGHAPVTPAADAGTAALAEPMLSCPTTVDLVPTEIPVHAEHTGGRLQLVELFVNDQPVDSVTLEPTKSLNAMLVAPFEKWGRGRYRIAVRATATNGESRTSPTVTVECSPASLPAEQLAHFALPMDVTGPIPELLTAPYGATAGEEAGARVFFAHAPSRIIYAVPAEARKLAGRFGFRPGAYAATNAGRTDGAEFVITAISAGGQRVELLRRLLRPSENPADRGEHEFAVLLPTGLHKSKIELLITNGPASNSASDWTYWADLVLKTSL